MLSLWIRISNDLVILLFLAQREGDTLTNGDFLYKCKFPIQKSKFYSLSGTSLVSVVSQNDQLKVILCQRGIFWGGIFYSPTVCKKLKVTILNR